MRAEYTVEILSRHVRDSTNVSLLDVGCGEGFLIASGCKKGWKTTGVDYQSAPVEKLNPEILDSFFEDNPQMYLNTLIESGEKKDILVIQNVLEHVREPEKLLQSLADALTSDGCIYVQVPNDFSELQMLAKKQDRIEIDYWFLPPQHLNYFNQDNIKTIAASCGLEVVDGFSDFPIEMYLWGNEKNYTTDKTLGKHAHKARVTLDLLFSRNGIQKYADFYRAAFNVGLGRNLGVVLKKTKI